MIPYKIEELSVEDSKEENFYDFDKRNNSIDNDQ